MPPTEGERTAALLAAFRGTFPSVERGARIALFLRFGWAPPPTVRVRRLPLEESLVHEPTSDG